MKSRRGEYEFVSCYYHAACDVNDEVTVNRLQDDNM